MDVPVSAALVLGATTLTYAAVLANTWGGFGLPSSGDSYWTSPYWLGLSPRATRVVTALQLVALAGYATWLVEVARGRVPADATLRMIHLLFVTSTTTWAPLAYRMLRDRTWVSTLATCASLWTTAGALLGLLWLTWSTSVVGTGGLLAASVVVVLVDGLGWTGLALARQIVRRA